METGKLKYIGTFDEFKEKVGTWYKIDIIFDGSDKDHKEQIKTAMQHFFPGSSPAMEGSVSAHSSMSIIFCHELQLPSRYH